VYSGELMKHMYLSKENDLLEAVASSILLPVTIELVFERNNFCKTEFSSCRNAPFVQTELCSQVEDKHKSLKNNYLCLKQD
jgi:hypothetical protein